jgi:hypothetical protein
MVMRFAVSLVAAIFLSVISVEAQEIDLRAKKGDRALQNARANEEQIPFVRSLNPAKEDLVSAEGIPGIRIDSRRTKRGKPFFDPQERVVRPWARDFFAELGDFVLNDLGREIQLNSACRTVAKQSRLGRSNANAAPAKGPEASLHLRCNTGDFTKIGWPKDQLDRLRAKLHEWSAEGRITVAEEFSQAVFHVIVWRPQVAAPPQNK